MSILSTGAHQKSKTDPIAGRNKFHSYWQNKTEQDKVYFEAIFVKYSEINENKRKRNI